MVTATLTRKEYESHKEKSGAYKLGKAYGKISASVKARTPGAKNALKAGFLAGLRAAGKTLSHVKTIPATKRRSAKKKRRVVKRKVTRKPRRR